MIERITTATVCELLGYIFITFYLKQLLVNLAPEQLTRLCVYDWCLPHISKARFNLRTLLQVEIGLRFGGQSTDTNILYHLLSHSQDIREIRARPMVAPNSHSLPKLCYQDYNVFLVPLISSLFLSQDVRYGALNYSPKSSRHHFLLCRSLWWTSPVLHYTTMRLSRHFSIGPG